MRSTTRILRSEWLLLGVLLLGAAVLLFTRLDAAYLWQDEAETAVVSRNVLRFGYPRAFDGIHLLHLPFATHRPGFVWVFHGWIQFYLTAASFLLFGITTWAARAPFALLGLGSIVLTWRMAKTFVGDRQVAGLTTFLLATSVPFLLHMRQCRYYAPMVVFSLCALLAYWRWLARARFSGWSWLISMLLAFHSAWTASVMLLLGMAGHWWFSSGRAMRRGRETLPWVIAFSVLATAWMLYAHALEHGTHNLLRDLWRNSSFYVKMINSYTVPLGLILAALIIPRCRRMPQAPVPDATRSALHLLGWVIGACLLVLLPARQHFYRYLLIIVPLLYLLTAWGLLRWLGHRPIALAATVLVMVATDVLHRPDRLLHGTSRLFLADYVYELTHDVPDSTRGIVEFLNAHAAPGETVKIRYSIAPLVFYTSLRVDTRSAAFFEHTYPDWIVMQQELMPQHSYTEPYFSDIITHYELIHTAIPDHLWGHAPDPFLHRFRPVTDWPGVVIFHKRATHQPTHAR
ncbi:MAG: glycosyltransferase family 39 protein [Candidatus Omnitrophica bacterium]|nr:glycosyltransferase family 39 protein [Candidatus Omnitrophota bacterium]